MYINENKEWNHLGNRARLIFTIWIKSSFTNGIIGWIICILNSTVIFKARYPHIMVLKLNINTFSRYWQGEVCFFMLKKTGLAVCLQFFFSRHLHVQFLSLPIPILWKNPGANPPGRKMSKGGRPNPHPLGLLCQPAWISLPGWAGRPRKVGPWYLF